ncbi:YczE/YyaS/YitT family protein [Leucobacter coleopterorum]|uniref:YczE/YyaS/YitT family protein n=1 Tax=Leucobacter coleopterorum TaxID=2714933 RepID=UPI001FCBBDBD|nr:hypothetical protein [Leucobacter coleopterorum]
MPRKLLQLIPGLILYGVADAFMIRAAIGVDSWTVFAQGLSVHSGFGIGIVTNVTGVIVLLLWWPLRQKPGLGTILNILLVGPGIELGLWLLPTPRPYGCGSRTSYLACCSSHSRAASTSVPAWVRVHATAS